MVNETEILVGQFLIRSRNVFLFYILFLGGKVGIMSNDKFYSGNCNDIITEERLAHLYEINDIQLLYASKLNRIVCVSGSVIDNSNTI